MYHLLAVSGHGREHYYLHSEQLNIPNIDVDQILFPIHVSKSLHPENVDLLERLSLSLPML